MFFEELYETYITTGRNEIMNIFIFIMILFGFVTIVLRSKKYSRWVEKIDKYF